MKGKSFLGGGGLSKGHYKPQEMTKE